MSPRRLFIAGATGAVGRTLLDLAATRSDVSVVPHVRPKHRITPAGRALSHPNAVSLELSDPALADAMRGSTTLVQLIGTMRQRFGSGDTYESSDVGTTAHLVNAAKQAGTVDHVVLLSSAFAGFGVGAYLKAKRRAEALVRDSGLPFTIFRPSAFVDREGVPASLAPLTRHLPAMVRGITLQQLAQAILHVAENRTALSQTLEGRSLWRVVEAS